MLSPLWSGTRKLLWRSLNNIRDRAPAHFTCRRRTIARVLAPSDSLGTAQCNEAMIQGGQLVTEGGTRVLPDVG